MDHAKAVDELDHSVPHVRVRCSRKVQLDLLEKLDSSGRLALLPLSQVRKGLENGMFAIPKDEVRDLLIMDARPANCCESSENRWIYSLGSLHQLLHVFLKPDQILRMHCEDLREIYHAFVIGDQRRVRNCLKAFFRPHQVQHLQCFSEDLASEDWLVPSLNTIAMGDTNAVAFGQVSHLSLLLRTKEFELSDFIGLKLRPSRKDWHAGLMIDDFVLVEKITVDSTGAKMPTGGEEKVKAVCEA